MRPMQFTGTDRQIASLRSRGVRVTDLVCEFNGCGRFEADAIHAKNLANPGGGAPQWFVLPNHLFRTEA